MNPNLIDKLTPALLKPWLVSWPEWMPRMAFAPKYQGPRGDTLVVVFLRGAADVLNMLVPHGEEAYYALRPTLGIPRPDDPRADRTERTVDLDGFFGLHPALAPLLEPWQAGRLAPVHAVGAPDESRSHFKAMELMERGVEDESGPATGWIGRHLATLDTGSGSPLRAIGLGQNPQRALRGPVPVTALQSIADFHLGGDLRTAAQMRGALAALYAGDDPVDVIGRETLEILDTLEAMNPAAYVPAGGAVYPAGDFGLGLRQIAMLVRAEVGLEVAAIDVGGWDTHFAQGGTEGQMARLMADLANGLAAFHRDMDAFMDRMTIVVMSEFGRRAYENASLGTDHGHGSAMFLMGGAVNGGKVHAVWPGMEEGQLFGPGDLAVTVDYRDVLAEVVAKRLNNAAVGEVFPEFTITERGIMKSR
jgi:uncharacterized protein (DUF1501 family)